jgi:hypothetical protein
MYVYLSNIQAYPLSCLLTYLDFTQARDVVFLDRMKDHALTIFAGALLLHYVPASLDFLFGPVLPWISVFIEKRAM